MKTLLSKYRFIQITPEEELIRTVPIYKFGNGIDFDIGLKIAQIARCHYFIYGSITEDDDGLLSIKMYIASVPLEKNIAEIQEWNFGRNKIRDILRRKNLLHARLRDSYRTAV